MAKKWKPAGRPARTPGAVQPPRTPGALDHLPSMRARAKADVPWNPTGQGTPPPAELTAQQDGA